MSRTFTRYGDDEPFPVASKGRPNGFFEPVTSVICSVPSIPFLGIALVGFSDPDPNPGVALGSALFGLVSLGLSLTAGVSGVVATFLERTSGSRQLLAATGTSLAAVTLLSAVLFMREATGP